MSNKVGRNGRTPEIASAIDKAREAMEAFKETRTGFQLDAATTEVLEEMLTNSDVVKVLLTRELKVRRTGGEWHLRLTARLEPGPRPQ